MEVKNLDAVKNNIITNFLIPYYKFTIIRIKKCIIADIIRRSWFPCEFDTYNDTITFKLSDDINITVKLIFEEKPSNESVFYLLTDFK